MQFDLSVLPANLHVGTSSFSTSDWCGVFYPGDLKPHDFLSHYSRVFETVEIDATWHFMPNAKTVDAWNRKTPDGFTFAAKVPKVITHEKILDGCEGEWAHFLETMDRLGGKLGPLLFQFQYVSKKKDPEEYKTGAEFLRRLERFFPLMPDRFRYVVEVRNRGWLAPPLIDLLRSRSIALAMVDYVTMPRPAEWFDLCEPVTADFAYVRFLGDHRKMDHLVATKQEEEGKSGDWNELLVDRTQEMGEWAPILSRVSDQTSDLFAYFNNHYAGFAPGSIDLFLRIYNEKMGTGSTNGSKASVPDAPQGDR